MFTYKIIANTTGTRPYRAATDYGPTVESVAFLTAVAAASGQDAATVEAVLRGTFSVASGYVSDARQVNSILGLFRVFPTSGGSYAVPDPAASDVAKTVSFNITPTPEFIATLQAGLTLHKTGESGLLAPLIDGVTTMPGGLADSFTPGQGLEIRGEHLRGRQAAIPTVQLINNTENSPPVPLLVLDASDTRLVCTVPQTGFDGSCYLKVITPYGGDQRIGQYSQLLAMIL